MTDETTNDQPNIERTEEKTTEKVVQEPAAPETAGPLGNVTQAVTTGEPVETVVERTEEKTTEKPAE